jgi:hypothetical protein
MPDDLEMMQLRDLAEEQNWLRHLKIRRELVEQERDEQVRRNKALEENADAFYAQLDIAERLVLRLILWCVLLAVVIVVMAVRLIT